MQLVDKSISIQDLKKMVKPEFGDLVKAVVDVEKEVMVVDSELHADQEAFLIKQGSKQGNLWGINLYPNLEKDDWIEFDSMINLRPSWGNKTRGVDSEEIRKKIIKIVNKLVIR